jgi:hypothetical protein
MKNENSLSGAFFSEDRLYRYALWRIWNGDLPKVMFIGLNPSTANESTDDPTIKRVISISKNLGFGGVYMLNVFPLVSAYPEVLLDYFETPFHDLSDDNNDCWLSDISKRCNEIVFAWGNFKIVRERKRDSELLKRFPQAKALHINKNGSPKHPLYCKSDTQLVQFNRDVLSEPIVQQ